MKIKMKIIKNKKLKIILLVHLLSISYVKYMMNVIMIIKKYLIKKILMKYL